MRFAPAGKPERAATINSWREIRLARVNIARANRGRRDPKTPNCVGRHSDQHAQRHPQVQQFFMQKDHPYPACGRKQPKGKDSETQARNTLPGDSWAEARACVRVAPKRLRAALSGEQPRGAFPPTPLTVSG